MPTIRTYKKWDISGGVQKATSRLLRKGNEVEFARNATFSDQIGGVSRRNGYVQLGNTLRNKDGLGAFVHRYGGSGRIFNASNNSGDTQTVVSLLDTGTGVWTDLITNIAPNTRLHGINYLDELFLAGVSTNDTYMTPRNISDVSGTATASTTQNLWNAPRGKYFAEYHGSLYLVNCEVNVNGTWTKYPDRAYKSSPPLGAITFVKGAHTGTYTNIAVDSVRYLKVGMVLDIYTARTETKLLDSVTISAVNKATDTITLSASTSIALADNDEIWLEDRKNKLTLFWNTDYPSYETADYLRVPPGEDGSAAFTGAKKYNNRLYFTTEDSTLKWDSQNFMAINDSVGCSSHEGLAVVSGWLIIPHRSGQIWAYNDNSGDWKLISRGVQKYLKDVPQTNWTVANSFVRDNVLKIALGSVTTLGGRDFNSVLRVVYDFNQNNWTFESHTRNIRYSFKYTLANSLNSYFQDDTGRLLRDDYGNLDLTATIPWEFNFGKDNLGIDEKKDFVGCTIYSDNWQSIQVSISIGGSEFKNIGELTGPVTKLKIPDTMPRQGIDIDYQFSHNGPSNPPDVLGISTHFSQMESSYAAG